MTTLLPRLFGDVSEWFDTEFPVRGGALIRVEDRMSDTEYVLRAEVPGLDPEKDVEVTAGAGTLTIRAERREEAKGLNRSEFRYGSLHRAVRLPANADEAHIVATYAHGILQVTVPLTAPAQTARQIEVQRTE